MSKLQYLLHSIDLNLEQNNNKIDEEIFTQLKKAFKLARLKQYLSELKNDELILKYTGKKLFNYITENNIELKKEDFKKILSYSTRETTNTKILKGFNKSKLSDEEQNEMINKYNEFNPYEEEFTPYLKSKGKTEGIKPRWCKVFAVGHSQKHVKVGDWLLIEHGRWTRAVTIEGSDGEINEIRRIDNTAIVLISDKKPEDVYFGESNKSNTHTFDFTKPMM